ncbi:MAG TPA: TetR/AcrR family transcriptional regulator [Mycobacteriales bacterium]|nr:TetR/AcrR family transcriptional regulator [Mycobacteriales bacterium]
MPPDTMPPTTVPPEIRPPEVGPAETWATAPAARRDRHTPESLLRVAVDVFTHRGYDGTSMEHIAAASGITKSSIYHHVRGKEELLRLALERATDGLFAVLGEAPAQTGPAIGRLEHVVRRSVEVLAAELPYVTLLLRVRGNTPTEVWALDRRRTFDRAVAVLAATAVAEGDLRDDVDSRLATRLLFGLVNSLTEWWRPDRGSVEQLADAIVHLAFDGLRR